MEFRLLGPLAVQDGAATVAVSAPRQRVLLAALLLNAGRVARFDELAAALWGERLPGGVRGAVHSAVQRLRARLGPAGRNLIVTRGTGYQFELGDGTLDVLEFQTRADQGHAALAAGRWEQAAQELGAALDLWRGDALCDVPSTYLHDEHGRVLAEQRLTALTARIDADLRLRREAVLIPELSGLVAAHPLRERFHEQLMLALYRDGRQADALAAFHTARRLLAAELGVEPGPGLRELHQRILDADPALVPGAPKERSSSPAADDPGTPEAVAVVPPPAETAETADTVDTVGTAVARPRPAQLPGAVVDFTGRAEQLKTLYDLLRGPAPTTTDEPTGDVAGERQPGEGAVPVVGICGAGGLGKTTLAVQVGHRLREHYPDGQLYVDLRGAGSAPLAPADVLTRLLRGLGVADDAIPAEEDERAALYRSTLGRRRVLVVLDDARDARQVRPLLPGVAGCAAIVTSRWRLSDVESARWLHLGVLHQPEDAELLARIAGHERLAAEPDATAEVLAVCSGLPLALRIAAARLAARPGWTVRTLADRLTDARRRLDELSVGDLAVRTCFEVSYQTLTDRQSDASDPAVAPARAFRLLGLASGASIPLGAAAALLDCAEPEAEDALETLVDASLVQAPEPGRYRLPDLLRLYAGELAAAEEPEAERARAIDRYLGWYLHGAIAVTRAQLATEDAPLGLSHPALPAPRQAPVFAAEAEAWGWCEAECANLVAAAELAAARGRAGVPWQVAVSLTPYLIMTRRLDEMDALAETGLAAARAAGDEEGAAWMTDLAGMRLLHLQRREEAIARHEEALAIFRRLGARWGESRMLNRLATVYRDLGRLDEAIDHNRLAAAICDDLGDVRAAAHDRYDLGECYREAGRYEEALECHRSCLDMARAFGSQWGEALALYGMGRTHHVTGALPEAARTYREAMAVARSIGLAWAESVVQLDLADVDRRLGDVPAARQEAASAMAALTEHGDPRASEAAGLLAELREE